MGVGFGLGLKLGSGLQNANSSSKVRVMDGTKTVGIFALWVSPAVVLARWLIAAEGGPGDGPSLSPAVVLAPPRPGSGAIPP